VGRRHPTLAPLRAEKRKRDLGFGSCFVATEPSVTGSNRGGKMKKKNGKSKIKKWNKLSRYETKQT